MKTEAPNNASESVISGNIQPHSAGDIFPFTLIVSENSLTGLGYVQVQNCENGILGTKFHYTRKGRGFQSFETAHLTAENEARYLLARDQVPYHKNVSEQTPLRGQALVLQERRKVAEHERQERVHRVQNAINTILGYGRPDAPRRV